MSVWTIGDATLPQLLTRLFRLGITFIFVTDSKIQDKLKNFVVYECSTFMIRKNSCFWISNIDVYEAAFIAIFKHTM